MTLYNEIVISLYQKPHCYGNNFPRTSPFRRKRKCCLESLWLSVKGCQIIEKGSMRYIASCAQELLSIVDKKDKIPQEERMQTSKSPLEWWRKTCTDTNN